MKNNLMKIKTVREWVMQWFEDFQYAIEEHPDWYTLEVNYFPTEHGRRMVTSISDGTHDGESICNETDQYNFQFGVAIAWAKLHHLPMPSELTPERFGDLLKIKRGERFMLDGIKYQAISTTYAVNDDNKNYALINVWNEEENWFDMLTIPTGLPKKERRVKML